MADCTVVIPTLGRPSLFSLVDALPAVPILVIDDRPDRRVPLGLPPHVRVLAGRSAGPAAARNVGWQAARTEWVVFLDDDVMPDSDWAPLLVEDLRDAGPEVGGVQARLRVPLPPDRRPTDWERVTASLADGEWITADMAYRRLALRQAGGFDERLPRAFREDAELAHRVRGAGWELRRGLRQSIHPVRPEHRWISIRTQRGNADDALLRHLYGPRWRSVLEIPPGRRHRHAVVTAAGAVALTALTARLLTGRRSFTTAAAVAGLAWAAGTAEFAWARIAPGPRDRREVTTMLLTSAAIPPVAMTHWVRGWRRWRGAAPIIADHRRAEVLS
ncbi:transferase [Actinoplanes sp. OR16]|uniref:glycosyltransferase family 2 protein n=1 Tax=Actinoplanes sp. OR16 TaxID=946334 RepID=UPI000F70E6C4|nr:glycosyltransferase [Actinoplanes sp. OR16]BBH70853.1 transferase [Actinoplanes sp. OR16]